MHYAEIAQAIIDKGYRKNVGATPANTVASEHLSASIPQRSESEVTLRQGGSRHVRPSKHEGGAHPAKRVEETDEAEEAAREMGVINAFGMFWYQGRVQWKTNMPRLLGIQQAGSTQVNFTKQAGVYPSFTTGGVVLSTSAK